MPRPALATLADLAVRVALITLSFLPSLAMVSEEHLVNIAMCEAHLDIVYQVRVWMWSVSDSMRMRRSSRRAAAVLHSLSFIYI